MKHLLTILTILMLPIVAQAAAESKYIIHSSGNALGLGPSESKAALVAPANAQPIDIITNNDGTVTLQLGSLYLQLGTANSWSTYWNSQTDTPRARYTIEQDGNYVRFKNQQTGKYLGTDDNAAGSSCFSDKSGTDTKHKWRLSDTPTIAVTVDTLSYPIIVDAERQMVEGWGVSLCWWAAQCGKWSQTKMDELLKWMVSPTGLNWNLFRYNIGGGDDPQNRNCTLHHMDYGKGRRAEMEGFQDERGGEYHWERDEAQRRIMLRIKELRPDAQFEAFSNSAPWWMTVSGCVSGSSDANSDNLRKDYYTDFAHYLVDVCKHYKDEYGIEFKTLEPFNEANTGYWKQSGQQEGCHVSPQSQVAFIKVLLPILKESGLSTQISASDETNVGGALNELNEYINAGLIKVPPTSSGAATTYVAQWNTHTYGADNRSRSQIGSLARSKGLTMWMSETGSGGSGIAGNLAMTKRLFDDVRYIASDAWMDWQYMEEKNDQWCMVQGPFDGSNHKRVKNYYVRQQVTRFIKPGYTIVTSMNENCLAAISPAQDAELATTDTPDTLVICLLNESDKTVHHLQLPMARIAGSPDLYRTATSESARHISTPSITVAEGEAYSLSTTRPVAQLSDSTLAVLLPSQSITTLIIPIKKQAACLHTYPDATASGTSTALWQPTALTHRTLAFQPGDTYLIVPQSNHTLAVGDTGSGMALSPANLDDPAQQWTLEADASAPNYFRLRSGKGRYATWQSSYALKTQTAKSSSQLYSIESVDGLHVRIIQKSGDKGWDLSGQNLSEGTAIGSWAHGGVATADTRQWILARIATPTIADAIDEIPAEAPAAPAIPVYYSIDGKRLPAPQHGINIVRTADGKYRKLMK